MADWTFDVTASRGRLMGRLMPLTIEMMRAQSEFAFDLTGDEDLEFQVNERVIAYVRDRIDHFAETTNDETIRLIEETISEGIQQGDTLYKLKQRISAVYFNANTIRAERIARTETIAASNEAALEAYRQSPITIAKEWHAEPSACEFCGAMNGKIVGLEEAFVPLGGSVEGTDEGTYQVNYQTVTHPPLHPNCRCAIVPVAID